LVNELIFVGVSPAYDGSTASSDPTVQAAALTTALTAVDNGGTPYDINICYSVSGLFSGSSQACLEEPVTPNQQSEQQITPEPGTSSLLGLGLACMLVMGRRLAKRLRS
jgi:hypothetical protein